MKRWEVLCLAVLITSSCETGVGRTLRKAGSSGWTAFDVWSDDVVLCKVEPNTFPSVGSHAACKCTDPYLEEGDHL